VVFCSWALGNLVGDFVFVKAENSFVSLDESFGTTVIPRDLVLLSGGTVRENLKRKGEVAGFWLYWKAGTGMNPLVQVNYPVNNLAYFVHHAPPSACAARRFMASGLARIAWRMPS
jgi:hypothetical protein